MTGPTPTTVVRIPPARPRAGFPDRFLRPLALILHWQAKARSRRALGRLGPERLQDLGLRPCDARAEARRPFWR